MTKTDATHYTYTYAVGAGNGAVTVSLGTGVDLAGNVITSVPTSGATYTVDNTAPTAAITYNDPDALVKAGQSLTITATFNEAIADAPVIQISLAGANTQALTNMTKTDATHYTYTYVVGAGNGAVTVSLGTGVDLAGNVITSAPTSGATYTVDDTVPTAAISLQN